MPPRAWSSISPPICCWRCSCLYATTCSSTRGLAQSTRGLRPANRLEFVRDGRVGPRGLIAGMAHATLAHAGRASSFLDAWQALAPSTAGVERSIRRCHIAKVQDYEFRAHRDLGGAVSLSRTPVMEVQADEGRYWRAGVLDRYTGSGWVDTNPQACGWRPAFLPGSDYCPVA